MLLRLPGTGLITAALMTVAGAIGIRTTLTGS